MRSTLVSFLFIGSACALDTPDPGSEHTTADSNSRGDVPSAQVARTAGTSDIVGAPARDIFDAIVTPGQGGDDSERAVSGKLTCSEAFTEREVYVYICSMGHSTDGLSAAGDAAWHLFHALRGGYFTDPAARQRQGFGTVSCGPIRGTNDYGCSLDMRTLRLESDAAQAMYDLLAVEEEVIGGGTPMESRTKRTHEGLRCQLTTSPNGAEDYYCEMGNGAVLAVGGDAARAAYRALRINDVTEGDTLVRAATTGMVCRRVSREHGPFYECEI